MPDSNIIAQAAIQEVISDPKSLTLNVNCNISVAQITDLIRGTLPLAWSMEEYNVIDGLKALGVRSEVIAGEIRLNFSKVGVERWNYICGVHPSRRGSTA